MSFMENLSMEQIKDFAIVLLAVAGLIVLIGNVVATVKGWRKPHEDVVSWRKTVDKKLENDNERLKSMEAGNKVICRGILAMLSHEINGNSIDKLKASQTEMTNYLIDR